MDKNDKLIMTVPVTQLFANGKNYFQGFVRSSEHDFEASILQNYSWTRRGDAEKDTSIKQPIGYCLIVNPYTKSIFAYQRDAGNNYDEKRLRGKWSWGIGGHIDKEDPVPDNPIQSALLRELGEEVAIKQYEKSTILGYINDDKSAVGRVHFGILYMLITNETFVKPIDPEISKGQLETIETIKKILNSSECEVENWSQIAYQPLKEHIS